MRKGTGRGTICIIKGCEREALCKKLCNAHYIRTRQGINLNIPIQIRNREGCLFEGCKRKHYGKGYCTKHYIRAVREERWLMLIKLYGNKCQRCKKKYHFSVYNFHHLNPSKKIFEIGQKITDSSIEEIKKECDKCILLCSNCHRLTHFETYGKS